MPSRRCLSPSCYNLAVQGETRCEKHLTVRKKEVIKHRNQNRRNAHIYDSKRWRVLAKKAKMIAGGLCEKCLRNGRESYGDVADHIVELEDGGEPFSLSNIEVLCFSCHASKTQREKDKRENKRHRQKGLVFI